MNFFTKHKETRGAIAILLVVILLPMMTLSAFMVDTARYNLAKSMVSSAGDLALNAGLANYDAVLKDVYGLFAMSQKEGNVEENVKEYFIKTLTGYGVVSEDDAADYLSSLLGDIYEYISVEDKETADLMSLIVDKDDITVEKAGDESSLANPDILEKQIIEYMKYRGPVDFSLSFLDSLSAFTKLESQTNVLETQVKAQESMEEVSKKGETLYTAVEAYDNKYEELQPEDASSSSLKLTDYGNTLNLYKYYYQYYNELTIIFCLGAKCGEWDTSALKLLNGEGDYIVKSGGTCFVPHTFTSDTFDESKVMADGYMSGLYAEVTGTGVSTSLTAYGATRISSAWTAGTELNAENIAGFQAADAFYKSSYDAFISAAEKVDRYVRAQAVYDTVLSGKIESAKSDKEDKEDRIEEIDEELKDSVLTAEKKTELEKEKSECETAITELENAITEYKNTKDNAASNLQTVLGNYEPYLNTYNSDLKLYRNSVETVENIVYIGVKSTADEINMIRNNLVDLKDLLQNVAEKLGETEKSIENYINNIDTWKKANNAYKDGGEGDSFSETNDAGIREAEETFNRDDIKELINLVRAKKDLIESCIGEIDKSFVFCGIPIKEINTAEKVKAAISEGVYGAEIKAYQATGEITLEECDKYFLYEGSVDPHFLDELSPLAQPYPCCKFLYYLYQTYKRDKESLASKSETEKTEASDNKAAYEKLKDGSSKAPDVESDSSVDYGYSYKGKSMGGEDYPSSGEKGTEVKMSKSNSSGSLTASKDQASELLGGLQNAMVTGRDKLLVTAYLFENFSYNTIVQDLAREGLAAEKGELPAWPFPSGADKYSAYLNAPKTSSGVAINSKNNQIYGAEIEYILFGSSDAAKNVTSMKASIYAIRFLFNAVYAFTNTQVRNETRAIAVAVQAASAGVIPYQLVQVVLQIALALGESAIDLQKMVVGEKVAIVKTKDTWVMSSTGMVNLAEDALKSVADEAVSKVAESLNDKLNEVTDAAADELIEAVDGIGKDLEQCVNNAVEEALGSITMQVTAVIDSAMNTAAYIADTDIESLDGNIEAVKRYAKTQVEAAFDIAWTEIESLFDKFSGSDGAPYQYVASILKEPLKNKLNIVEEEVLNAIDSAPTVQEVRARLFEQVNQVKEKVNAQIQKEIQDIIEGATVYFEGKINEVNTYIQNQAKTATEEAKKNILDKINGFVDDMSKKSTKFIEDALPDNLAELNGNAVKSSSKAAMIRFGYSDYLKLFVFIGLCASDKSGSMLKRTADLIQANISKAEEGSDLFREGSASFTMNQARTYLSIDARVDLKLMFLNLGVFQKQIDAYNEELPDDRKMDTSSTLTVNYIGIAGY